MAKKKTSQKSASVSSDRQTHKLTKKTPAAATKIKKTTNKTSKVVTGEIVDANSENEFESQEIKPDLVYKIPDAITDLPDEDLEKMIAEPLPNKALVSKSKSHLPSPSTHDPLALYLAEIRKYPLLSKEQEKEIAQKYFESKDPLAAQALVQANLRFVVKIAAEYSKFGAKMIDLIQEGNVGLMHAVKEYNPYKGARLITYAVWWIRGYIQEYLMRHYSIVRIGTTQNQRKLFYQLQKEKVALDALGIEPNISLLSSRMGIPEDEVSQMAQRMSGRDVSLDKPVDDESGQLFGDLQKSNGQESLDDQLAQAEMIDLLKLKIEEIRPSLNEKEKIILEERLLNDEPLTLQEIGEKYGITREAVRQAEARLMRKIKEKMNVENES